MVVLTSRVSASASEILAGALKDYGRAVIVGDDHTFGKGTVQTISQLPGDNGALKVTTALFFRPGGQSTQHSGVRADVVLPSLLSSDDYGEKSQRYSLPPQTTTPFLGTSANATEGKGHWDPVADEVVGTLAERSATRIAKDDEFGEIRELLAEQQENAGVVKLADIMKRREEESQETDDTEGEEKEEDSPQLEEALDVLRQQEFALVLLDIALPGMNGFEVARAIHETPELVTHGVYYNCIAFREVKKESFLYCHQRFFLQAFKREQKFFHFCIIVTNISLFCLCSNSA